MSTILVVEDNPASRNPLARLLRAEGFEAVAAETGQGALDAVNVARPGLILLDLMMPAMGGLEFLKILRQNPIWADLPVIVVTGLPPHDAAVGAARRLGVRACFTKASFTLDQLMTAIRRHVVAIPAAGAPA